MLIEGNDLFLDEIKIQLLKVSAGNLYGNS